MAILEADETRMEFDPARTPPSTAVVEALAEMEDVDPTELFPGENRLQDYVDADALDSVLTAPRQDVMTVSVSIEEYVVRIRSSGAIEVRSTARAD